MTRAFLLSEHDLDDWYARYLAGEVPAPLPYGVDALQQSGYALRGAPRAADPRWKRLRDVVEHRSGFPVERTLRGARTASQADVVIALLEGQGAAAALLRRSGIPPYGSTPLVLWSVWLAEEIRAADATRRARIRRRIEAADLITHMSRHEAEIFIDLGIPEDRLHTVQFGVNHEFYVPGEDEKDIELLAVGQDRGRDYATLFNAIRGTDLTLDLVCKQENLVGLEVPENVRLHGTVPLSRYRELIRRARVVAVPTHDLAYPTGQSVALESASSGACVVVTGTRAMRDYFTDHADARLVDEGDVDGWRSVLTELRDDRAQREDLGAAARRSVETTFNSRRMWTELAGVIRERGLV